MNMRIKPVYAVLKDAARGIANDRVAMMGAALAYYTLFSIAPLLVIALGVVGMVFGDTGDAQIFDAIGGMMGENGAMAIRGMVRGAVENPHGGMIAALIGFLTLVVGASGIFLQLQDSLNMIWKVVKKPGAGVWPFVKRRLLSCAMIGVIAFMLLVSLIASAAIAAASNAVGVLLPGGSLLWKAVNVVISVGVIAFPYVKSKRRLSGPTYEPAWVTVVPRTCLNAACRRWVAVWFRLIRARRLASTIASTGLPRRDSTLEPITSCQNVPELLVVFSTISCVPLTLISPVSPVCPPDSP